jgi:hypothetical protein
MLGQHSHSPENLSSGVMMFFGTQAVNFAMKLQPRARNSFQWVIASISMIAIPRQLFRCFAVETRLHVSKHSSLTSSSIHFPTNIQSYKASYKPFLPMFCSATYPVAE